MKLNLSYNLNVIHNGNFITLCYSSTRTSNKVAKTILSHVTQHCHLAPTRLRLFQVLNKYAEWSSILSASCERMRIQGFHNDIQNETLLQPSGETTYSVGSHKGDNPNLNLTFFIDLYSSLQRKVLTHTNISKGCFLFAGDYFSSHRVMSYYKNVCKPHKTHGRAAFGRRPESKEPLYYGMSPVI
jgi:hypothetical protein